MGYMDSSSVVSKGIKKDCSGREYERYAIRTRFVEAYTDKASLVEEYVRPLYREGDLLAFGAKVMSLCEGCVKTRDEVKPGLVARCLYRFSGYAYKDTKKSPGLKSGFRYTGTGVHDPHKLQLVIDIVGLPRLLLAAFCSAVTKPFGIHGVFYRVCGHGIAGIDGFHLHSDFKQYYDMALINPANGSELCDELLSATGIPVVLMDANDFDPLILGKCSGFPMEDADVQAVMADNPAGQGIEMTPLILIRPVGKGEAER